MTHTGVEVRQAGVADLDDLLLLWGQARDELSGAPRTVPGSTPEQLRPRLRAVLSATSPADPVHVLVARLDGVPVGYALLRVAPVFALTEGTWLQVEHLFVAPAARRRGVGRALLAAAVPVAERHGAEQVTTAVPPGARDSHRFLARLGFSPFVVRRVVPTAVLRRRLAGPSRRGALEELLSRRRSLRARTAWAGPAAQAAPDAPADVPPAAPGPLPPPGEGPQDTLELPVVDLDRPDTPRPRRADPSTQPA